MTMPRGPSTSVGNQNEVGIDGVNLILVDGTWKVSEAPRFGEKISTGSLRYADFNTFESAHAVASFVGGYGLRRYSDVPNSDDPVIQTCEDEVNDCDCRFGPVILAPQRLLEDTGLDGQLIWMGEFTPAAGSLAGQTQFIAVGGTKVAIRGNTGLWSLTTIALPATAKKGAVGVFNGILTLGFGADAQAVFSDDLSTTTPILNLDNLPLYAYAFTADRAATYVAGGLAVGDANHILASTNGKTDYDTDNAVICSTSEGAITSLAPGGGLALLYVGRVHELGEVDNNGVYRSLLPFDSALDSNAQPMRWALGGVGQGEQRGPVRLFLSRDRSFWAYKPSSDSAGDAQNVSVWAKQGFRPQDIRGITTAIQGTARWLYHTIHNDESGNSYLLAMDANTGAVHPIGSLGAVLADAMGVTSLFGTRPNLFVGSGADVLKILLPLDGENPIDDTQTVYQLSGTFTMPDIDLGFPDEDKIGLFFRVVGTAEQEGLADGLQPGDHSIDVELSFDGGPYQFIGTASTSPSVEMFITGTPAFKRVKPRFTLRTNQPLVTPQLLGFSMRVSLNAKLYRIWEFEVKVPADVYPTGGQILDNPQTLIDYFWFVRRRGTPITFSDRWNFDYNVRILNFAEQEIATEPLNTPETRLAFRLLEVAGPTGAPYHLAYGDPRTIYGGPMPNSTYGL